MKKFTLLSSGLLLLLVVLCGCGGGSKKKTVSVSLSPSSSMSIDQGQTLSFSATLADDSSGKGVSWTMSGAGCTGADCGTFTNSTTTAVTYNAPGAVSANMTVTVQATSVANTAKSASTTVVVSPAPSITTTTLASGTVNTAYTATLQAAGGAGSLTWSLAGGTALPAGLALSSSGTISGTPTAAGSKDFTVQVTDQSAAQEGPMSVTQALTIVIGLPPVSVSLNPASQMNIDQGQTLNFTATVANDPSSAGVTWTASGTGCSGTACGSFTSSTPFTAIYNAPATVSGNTTISVQAFSASDTTESAATPVVVAPAPAITTATLTDGAANTAYSATLQATGGTGTLTWSLASGSALPAGLSLSSAGTLSGTPTAAATSTFTVKVTDASQGQQGPVSATRQLSLTIAAAPLTITTTSLPNATVGSAYNQSVQASGGATPYTWSVAGGSTLPSWLSLGASGTLSGTPTASGTATFSLTVTDSATPTPQTKTQAYTLTITTASATCGSGNESVMKGQFAFILEGSTADGFLAAVGSFTADGTGKITAGYVDANSELAENNGIGAQSGAVTPTGSSYSLGSDNRGCATIVTPFHTFITHFAISPTPSGSAQGTMMEFEPAPAYFNAAGQIFQQQVPATVPKGNWVYAKIGAIQTALYESKLMTVGVDVYGNNGTITDGEFDYRSSLGITAGTGVTGTYTASDPTTGRFTLTTTGSLGLLSAKSVNHAAYLVSGTRALEISTGASTILAGEMRLQSGSLTLSGNLATYGSDFNNGVAGLGLANATGTSYTASIYLDSEGAWTTPTPVPTSCSYTIDSLGRAATSGSNCGSVYSNGAWSIPPVIYLTAPATGYLEGGAGIWKVEPQTATSISNGNYYFGTQFYYDDNVSIGVASITGGDSLTGTEDSSVSGSGQQTGIPITGMLTVSADGTFSTSDNPGVIVGLVVSGTRVAVINHINSDPRLLIFNLIPPS